MRRKNEKRKTKKEDGVACRDLLRFAFYLLSSSFTLFSCASHKQATTMPASGYDRSEAALRDPFGYSPDVARPADISGGKINELDKKGMRKDIDNVLNP